MCCNWVFWSLWSGLGLGGWMGKDCFDIGAGAGWFGLWGVLIGFFMGIMTVGRGCAC